MLTSMDKAWVGGLVAWLGHLLSAKLGFNFVTPELIALVTGVVVYWIPNKQDDAGTQPPPAAPTLL
ncbi:MAG TPA: hypothetical protein VG758_18535 [Hyphomicrobiaceae bacterium]|jgi:hypothetical protein|nr:hypothetical protein [Hyphomicrobiaceae bacterium]